MRQVCLKHKVIGGHLLQDLTMDKWYNLYPISNFQGFVLDETDKRVYISRRCLKTYLKERQNEM